MARLRAVLCLCFLLGTATIVPAAGAASFKLDRDATLPVEMVTKPVGPFRSAPYSVARDRVWRQVIRHPTPTQSMRLEIRIVRTDIAAPWRVVVKDLERTEHDRIDGKKGLTGTFWTAAIPGQGAVVEVWTDGPPDGLEIEIEHYAYTVLRGIPQSIHREDQRIAITDVPDERVRSWGTAVAHLRFMTTRKDGSLVESSCTGFLLGGDLLITNHHCIRGDLERQSAMVELGYDSYGAALERYRIISLEVPAPELDYSIVRLNRVPSSRFHPAVAAGDDDRSLHFRKPEATGAGFRLKPLNDGRQLVIIEHSPRKPKQVSSKECEVEGVLLTNGNATAQTDFGHTCDTVGGSSGSPVIDAETGEILGLHHLGSGQDGSNLVNQAVYFPILLNDLEARNRAIFKKITEAP